MSRETKRQRKPRNPRKNNIVQGMNESARTYHRYIRRLEIIALSRIKWTGLPDTMDERFLEKTLLYQGFAVIYDAIGGEDPENPVILGTRGTPVGPPDLYDNYHKWVSIGNGGHYQQVKEGEGFAVYDSKSRRETGSIIQMAAEELAENDRIDRINLRQQRMMKYIVGTEEQQSDMKRFMEALDSGDPYVFAVSDTDRGLGIDVTTVDLTAPFQQSDHQEKRLNMMNNILEDLGIKTQPFDKSQYQHLEEVTITDDRTARIREDMLEPRRKAADMMNEKWGLDVKVDWSNSDYGLLDMQPSAAKEPETGEGDDNA